MHTERTYPVGFVVAEIPVNRLAEFVHLETLMSTSSSKLYHLKDDIHHIPNIFVGAFIGPAFLLKVRTVS